MRILGRSPTRQHADGGNHHGERQRQHAAGSRASNHCGSVNAPPVIERRSRRWCSRTRPRPSPASVSPMRTRQARRDDHGHADRPSGLLSASGAGTITGAATASLTIAGTLAQVNADLAALDRQGCSLAADSIAVNASDSRGVAAQQTVAVAVNAPPVIAAPVSGSCSRTRPRPSPALASPMRTP